MRGTKYFCIIVGLVLVIGSVFPAPWPHAIQANSWTRVAGLVDRWLQEGVLTVDASKLAGEPRFQEQPTESPDSYVRNEIIRAVAMPASRAVRPYWIGIIVIGLLWIAVGIRIPSRFAPASPAPPSA
jgi:hypothetical protein